MKIKHLLIVFAITLLGCSKDNIQLNQDKSGESSTYSGVIPPDAVEGIAYIKLKPDTKELSSVVALSHSGFVTTGIDGFDMLSQKFSVTSMKRVFSIEGEFEARKREAELHLWYVVEYDKEKVSLMTVLSEFENLKEVELIEPEVKVSIIGDERDFVEATASMEGPSLLSTTFNDPRLKDQWHYNNDGSITNSRAGADINLFKAWEITTGLPEVIVAVIDSGVDINHEDLKANLWVNTNTLPENPYREAVHGWNFTDNSAVMFPANHGTHVAGTVAAVNNNDIGVSGVAGGDGTPGTGARIMVVQIADAGGYFTNDGNISNGFIFAADNGAIIAQNSWGMPYNPVLPTVLKTGIDYFIKNAGVDASGNQTGPMKGGVVIFAAGNDGHGQNVASMPGAYQAVISVASMGPDYKVPYYSQYGSWVTITAPGGIVERDINTGVQYYPLNGVLSSMPHNTYGFYQGTSMAAPHLSGVAALIISKFGGIANPGFTQDMLREKLRIGSNRIDNYNHSRYLNKIGSGNIDAYQALTGITDSSVPGSVTDLVGDWDARLAVHLEWSVTADSKHGTAHSYQILRSEKDLTGVDFDNPPAGAVPSTVLVGDKNVGEKLKTTSTHLELGKTYYVAISALNLDYIRSETAMMISGVAQGGVPPDAVTDLTGTWSSVSVLLSWSVTADRDTEKTNQYEILVSKDDLTGVDFDNPPAGTIKKIAPVGYHAVGSKMYQTINDLEANAKYYASITGVDVDGMRSEAMMITNNQTVEPGAPTVIGGPMPDMNFSKLEDTKTIDFKTYFADEAGVENLTFTAVSDLADLFEISVAANGIASVKAKKYGTASITVKATNKAGLSVTHPTGFKAIAKDGTTPPPPVIDAAVSLRPNPVVRDLNITMDQTLSNVEVSLYNSMGAKVISETVSVVKDVATVLNLSKISGGVYTAVVKYGDKEYKQRITKL